MLNKTNGLPSKGGISYLRTQVVTWPNLFTTLRFFCAIGIFIFPGRALLVFTLAFIGAVSDAIDGWLARRFGLGTDFGKVFDQWVDWCFGISLICAIYVAGGLVFSAPPFNGELVVLIGGYLLARLKYPIAETTISAKWKTAMQFSGAVFVLGGHAQGAKVILANTWPLTIGYMLLWASVGLMFLSGWEYYKQKRTRRTARP